MKKLIFWKTMFLLSIPILHSLYLGTFCLLILHFAFFSAVVFPVFHLLGVPRPLGLKRLEMKYSDENNNGYISDRQQLFVDPFQESHQVRKSSGFSIRKTWDRVQCTVIYHLFLCVNYNGENVKGVTEKCRLFIELISFYEVCMDMEKRFLFSFSPSIIGQCGVPPELLKINIQRGYFLTSLKNFLLGVYCR